MYSIKQIALLLCTTLFCGPIMAQTQMGWDLIGDENHNSFASSVSMSHDGSIMAVGGRGNSVIGQLPYVRIFFWDGVLWRPKGNEIKGEFLTDYAPDLSTISSDGETVLFPHSGNSDGAPGSFRVFDWDGSSWVQRGETILELQANSGFGRSAQISGPGNHVIIGANTINANGLTNVGAVQVYEWLDGAWSQKGSSIFGTQMDEEKGDRVDISDDGSRIIIGSYNKNANGMENNGEVRAYEYVGEDWEPIGQRFVGDRGNEALGLFAQITADGNRIFFTGGLNGNEEHEIRIFDWQDDEWVATRPAIFPVESEEGFGKLFQVSDSGDQVAVRIISAGNDDEPRIALYEWRTGSYVRVGDYLKGINTDLRSGFSSALSISGDGNRLATGTSLNLVQFGRLGTYDFSSLVPVYEASSFYLSIFPNPTADVLTLRGNQLGELRLLDVTGRQLQHYPVAPANINLHGLPSGTYLVQVRQGNRWVSRRIVR